MAKNEETTFVRYTEFPRAGFFRRFGSWVYDALIAIAVYMVAGAIGFGLFALAANIGIVDTAGFEHLIDVKDSSIVYQLLVDGWSLGWVAFFFVYFWARNGQTIGMKAWRLRVQNLDGSVISKKTGWQRLVPTLLGLGNLWLFIDWKNKLSLQDKLTQTEVVVLSLAANEPRR
ncbi:RDD family protein [Thalassotalea euphylliae]|uniref:RDD family protein n=1 Tax=Thalassotalea euphylliae TaxID=1655234 RepID=A0A3E0TUH0_9GAMM|nr:RDD family protein [Thalassotalea euphylliae]REL28218.1 RDD family protein [Thalassotalea euphylliae]